jgi:hypothetical protein
MSSSIALVPLLVLVLVPVLLVLTLLLLLLSLLLVKMLRSLLLILLLGEDEAEEDVGTAAVSLQEPQWQLPMRLYDFWQDLGRAAMLRLRNDALGIVSCLIVSL